MNIDHSILTLIIFTPLAGALLLALLPDRGKTMQWTALAVTLFSFLLKNSYLQRIALVTLITSVINTVIRWNAHLVVLMISF